MSEPHDDFEDDFRPTEPPAGAELVVDVGGFEGPIDLLLTLARDQKVDLTHISILELADQYLGWVAQVRNTNLELAADYLVMAAWLAYLKSRLLLPDLADAEEPTGAEMAAALPFQLLRLEAMQNAGARLMARPRLGQEYFARGAPESFAVVSHSEFELSLFELLKAYADQNRRADARTLRIDPSEIMSADEAVQRMRSMLGGIRDWATLEQFLPAGLGSEVWRRSTLAATLSAALLLSKEGQIELRQSQSFGPIQLRPTGGVSEVP